MPPPLNTPVCCRVIVILIALPAHAVELPDVAAAACASNLPVVAFAARGPDVVGTPPSGVEVAVPLGDWDENCEAVQQVPCHPRARTLAPPLRRFAWEAARSPP